MIIIGKLAQIVFLLLCIDLLIVMLWFYHYRCHVYVGFKYLICLRWRWFMILKKTSCISWVCSLYFPFKWITNNISWLLMRFKLSSRTWLLMRFGSLCFCVYVPFSIWWDGLHVFSDSWLPCGLVCVAINQTWLH